MDSGDQLRDVVEGARIVGLSPPSSVGEAFADVILFAGDDVFQRVLDQVAPASPATMDDRPMSETTAAPPAAPIRYRDRIAAAAKPRKRESKYPDGSPITLNGMPVDVVGMRAGESQQVTDASVTIVGRSTKIKFAAYYPAILIACVMEPGTDTPVYTNSAEDLAAIGALDADEVEKVVEIAQRLSGKTKEAEKAIAGNFAAADDD
jgi:hypothetical protein